MSMPDSTNSRKSEVIDLILRDRETDREAHAFDRIRLIHRALPERDLGAIDASTTFMGKRLSFPLLISCMTGGDDDRLRTINRNLAAAAEAEGVAMGVGSQRVMFTHPESRDCFEVRRHAPTTLLFSNLGAVQLNYGFGLAEAREAVRVAGADALVFHLNPLQEAVQPEGNTNFTGLADKIGRVASELGRPVVVKEVGAGLSAADVERLLPLGVRYFDVAGSGGTSWSRIEHHRRDPAEGDDRGLLFQDWGIPTPVALERLAPCRDRAVLIA
jgi:isopentenyl-diphosphate delta-isomerase